MTARKTMQRRKKKPDQVLPLFLIGGGLLVLGIVALVLLPKTGGTAESGTTRLVVPAAVEYAAPEIKLTDLQGGQVALADYRGQVVLVNNWATWCPPCKAEMPTLQDYYLEHKDQQFTIIAIEAGEPAAEVAEFARSYELAFPVWPDPSQEALKAFRNDSLPSSYVIDRTGTVRQAWTGAISREMLEKYVTPLLEE